MLTAGQTNNVSFKVNVMGTSAEPKVRVILGSVPELSFTAKQDGEKWTVPMMIPQNCAGGSYDLRVEVVLNNRLFTPINKKIEITGIQAPEVVASPEVQQELPAAVMPEVDAAVMPEVDAAVMPEVPAEKIPAPEMPQVVAKMPDPVKKSMFASIASEEVITPKPIKERADPLSKLASIAASKPKRKYEVMRSGLPKPMTEASKPIRVRISEIDAVTSKAVSRIVKAVQEVKAPMRATAKAAGAPVKLVKEELFYE